MSYIIKFVCFITLFVTINSLMIKWYPHVSNAFKFPQEIRKSDENTVTVNHGNDISERFNLQLSNEIFDDGMPNYEMNNNPSEYASDFFFNDQQLQKQHLNSFYDVDFDLDADETKTSVPRKFANHRNYIRVMFGLSDDEDSQGYDNKYDNPPRQEPYTYA